MIIKERVINKEKRIHTMASVETELHRAITMGRSSLLFDVTRSLTSVAKRSCNTVSAKLSNSVPYGKKRQNPHRWENSIFNFQKLFSSLMNIIIYSFWHNWLDNEFNKHRVIWTMQNIIWVLASKWFFAKKLLFNLPCFINNYPIKFLAGLWLHLSRPVLL